MLEWHYSSYTFNLTDPFLHRLFKGHSEGLNALEALLWIFFQGLHHHLLDFQRECRKLLAQRWRLICYLLSTYLSKSSLKGTNAAQPFIGNHRQRILITGRLR